MEDALHRFNIFNDVFLLGQANKRAKAKANALRTELMKKWKVTEVTSAETLTQFKKQREMNSWRDYLSHQIDVPKEFDADFNFPEIHLMAHGVKHIRRYGAL